MKKAILTLVVFGALMSAAWSQNLTFRIEGLKDTTIHLAKYFGPKLYYADTAQCKNGVVTFNGSKHMGGLYAVVLPGGNYFEFIHDKEVVDMSVNDQKNFVDSMVVNASGNNKVFYEYIHFMTANNKRMQELTKEFESLKEDDPKRETLKATSKAYADEVKAYQQKLVTENPGTFIATMVGMSMEIDLPDYPRDENGNVTDSAYIYNYYIAHYWDNVDLKDARIVNTPVYHNKLDKFFSSTGVLQIPDSIIRHSVILLNKMDHTDQQNKVFQYTLAHIVNKYANSKFMGMDKVTWAMGLNYYCSPNNKAWWMTEQQSNDFCESIEKLGRQIIGNPAINLILTDTTETKWINMHSIPAEYTILYFWSPTCGHCKTSTPQVQTLYEKKFKQRGIEIYAIAEATGSDFVLWKKFIRDNGLTFINVGLTPKIYDQAMKDARPLLQYTTLESLNYSSTYDISSTPQIFVLDKDKKIMFKKLGVPQLEEIMDDITGHKEDLKLFPDTASVNNHSHDDGHGH